MPTCPCLLPAGLPHAAACISWSNIQSRRRKQHFRSYHATTHGLENCQTCRVDWLCHRLKSCRPAPPRNLLVWHTTAALCSCFSLLMDRSGLVQTGTKLSDQHLRWRPSRPTKTGPKLADDATRHKSVGPDFAAAAAAVDNDDGSGASTSRRDERTQNAAAVAYSRLAAARQGQGSVGTSDGHNRSTRDGPTDARRTTAAKAAMAESQVLERRLMSCYCRGCTPLPTWPCTARHRVLYCWYRPVRDW